MIKCSVGICAYNEEKNIEKLLKSVLSQKLKDIKIEEVLIIVSGSTDKTSKIINKFSKTNKKIKLIKQKKREGKASAVNLFIRKAKNEILILLSADLLLEINSFQKLIEKFMDPEVGMTGAHPVPLNNSKGFTNLFGKVMWDLHHRLSLKSPKMGELIAFRKVFIRIPIHYGFDEANIEPLIRGQGYSIKYVPNAKVYNKAPTTMKDLIKQRRRNHSGHLAIREKQGYKVSTLNLSLIFKVYLSFLIDNPGYIFVSPLIFLFEAYIRFLGWWDYKITKKNHTIWDFVESTKELN